MKTISFKSTAPDVAIPLLNNALEREKRILRNSIAKVQKRIDVMARDLSISPEELLSGMVPHPEAKDMELIELEGELGILSHLQDELRELESLELCA